MLNSIKGLIQSKKAYMEAAQLIMEDTEIDDSIVLGEEPEESTIPAEVKEVKTDETVVEPTEDVHKEPEVSEEEPAVVPVENPIIGDLPTPAAAPSGEEIPDDSVNLMTAEIDLATNTQTDVLPVPPANAADAVEDPDAQVVDSGFSGEEEKAPIEDTQALMTDPVDEPAAVGSDIVSQEAPAEESSLVEEKVCGNCESKEGSEEKVEEKCESTEVIDLLSESMDDDNFNEYVVYIPCFYYTWYCEVMIKNDVLEGDDDEVIKNLTKLAKKSRRPMQKAVNNSIKEENKERGLFHKLPPTNVWFAGKKGAIFPGMSVKKKIKDAVKNGDKNIKLYITVYTETTLPMSKEAKSSIASAITKGIRNEVADSEWLTMDANESFALVDSGENKEKNQFADFDNKIFDVDYEAPESEVKKESAENIMDNPIDEDKVEKKITAIEDENKKVSSEVKNESAGLMTEAISLGDEQVEDGNEDAGTGEGSSEDAGTAPDEGQENEVTSAVKDKVEEITSDDAPSADDQNNANEILMKKLSALTKSIEDAKALVLKGIK